MSKTKWLLVFLIALGVAIPAQAVEVNLGGFPSYFRQRVRYIKNATFLNTLSTEQAQALGYGNSSDDIFFADTTFRLTPQLVLSDSVTIRTQVDVFSNNLWGGSTSELLGGGSSLVNSAISPDDRFRGALLTGPGAIDKGEGFMRFRMLHIDMVLPNNLGFVRIGRQPFDWGLGILANGGWDPHSDLGFLVDRFLWLKTFPTGSSSITAVFVSDIFTGGTSVSSGSGIGYDIGAVALIWNQPNMSGVNLTIGGYVFPYIHQNNLGAPVPQTGTAFDPNHTSTPFGDLSRFTLYAAVIDLKTDSWRLIGELQGGWGEVDNFFGSADTTDIDNQLLWAVRGEMYPNWPVKVVGAEFGWADGDKSSTGVTDTIEGGIIVFNPAYNLDNLLFKHMIPNLYQVESSVYNAYYARLWGTVKVADSISFTPQVIVAFNEETNNPSAGAVGGNTYLGNFDTYMATEVEGTLTWHIHPGVSFDLIGGVVFTGSSLEAMLEQQAIQTLAANDISPDRVNYSETPWTVQGRLMIFIDQFFK